MDHQIYRQWAVSAAEAAGELLRTTFAMDADVRLKEGRDIKTRADTAAENCIKELLAPSGIPVLAEESSDDQGEEWKTGLCWLVDPLDGTMNFARGFPVCGVSIGLWSDGQPLLGVVHDIVTPVTYTGIVGEGAWRGDARIAVSTDITTKDQAVLTTGFPIKRAYDEAALRDFVKQVQQFKKIRMIGSAALALVQVAKGTFDVYYEEDIMIWDVAAGLALVKAAGGAIAYEPGNGRHTVHARATNGRLHL